MLKLLNKREKVISCFYTALLALKLVRFCLLPKSMYEYHWKYQNESDAVVASEWNRSKVRKKRVIQFVSRSLYKNVVFFLMIYSQKYVYHILDYQRNKLESHTYTGCLIRFFMSEDCKSESVDGRETHIQKKLELRLLRRFKV